MFRFSIVPPLIKKSQLDLFFFFFLFVCLFVCLFLLFRFSSLGFLNLFLGWVKMMKKEEEDTQIDKTRKRKRGLFQQANRKFQKRRQEVDEERKALVVEVEEKKKSGGETASFKEMRRISNNLFLKMDYGCAESLSEFFLSQNDPCYSPLHPSLQKFAPSLSQSFSIPKHESGVWEIFKLWLECNATFAQHRFSRCFSASLTAIILLSGKGSSIPTVFSPLNTPPLNVGKERRVLAEDLRGLFLVRKKILLAHFQSLCLLSFSSQETTESTTSSATRITKMLLTILDPFPSPLRPSPSGEGGGGEGICVYGDFEMGLNILHLLLDLIKSLPKVNPSLQNSSPEDLLAPFDKRKVLVLLLKKLRGYCEWFFCCACSRKDVPPYLADRTNSSPDFSEKRISELLHGCTSLLSFSTKALLRREGEIKRGESECLVGSVVSVLRSLGVAMFGEGDEVGGLVVMRECVKMRKVIGSRKVYIQGVVLMCFLELLSLKGEGEGVVGAMEREEVSPEATFTRCLSVLEEVQHEDWIASLLISHIHLRRSNWKEADTILEQSWKVLEIGSINFPASPYNLSAFNLDSLRWFVQSMRGICKKMMGDYPGALKMITSSVENASSADLGGHLLSMFNLAAIYKHCGENEAATTALSSYNTIREANESLSFCSCFLSQTSTEVTDETPSSPQLVLTTSCPNCAIWDIGLDGVVQYELGSSDLTRGDFVRAIERFDRFVELMRFASSGHTLSSSSLGSCVPSKTFSFVDECEFLRRLCYGLLQLGEYERCGQMIEQSLSSKEDFTLQMYLSDASYHLGGKDEAALLHLDNVLSLVHSGTKEQQGSEKRELWFRSPQTAQVASVALNNRAILLSRLGKLFEAFDSLKMAVSCSPSPKDAIYYNFCTLLSHHGYLQDASAVWLKFRGFDLDKKQMDYYKKEYNFVSQRLRKGGINEEEKKFLSFDCSLLQIWALQLADS